MYAPKRRVNLDATSYGPLVKLVIALAVLAVLVLVVVFVAMPLLQARASTGAPIIGSAQTQDTAIQPVSPLNPILTNAVWRRVWAANRGGRPQRVCGRNPLCNRRG